uniref:Putative secreted peptide n=1 Tax=Anopheles braziliensis TaxID=58242 RepID=A0A2M3ZXJ8_9DIPT
MLLLLVSSSLPSWPSSPPSSMALRDFSSPACCVAGAYHSYPRLPRPRPRPHRRRPLFLPRHRHCFGRWLGIYRWQ